MMPPGMPPFEPEKEPFEQEKELSEPGKELSEPATAVKTFSPLVAAEEQQVPPQEAVLESAAMTVRNLS